MLRTIQLGLLRLLLGGLTIHAAPARGAERYRSDQNGFSVEIPSRWVSVSPNVITQINTAVATFLKQNVSYLACFVPKGHTSSELPRILIQYQSWDGGAPTYDAIEETLKRDVEKAINKVKKDTSIPVDKLHSNDVMLDRANNRIVMRLRASVPGDGAVQALSMGMLGKDGIVFLHCYARQDSFAKSVPLFEVLADSFKFDAGKQYDPAEATVTTLTRPESGRSPSFSWSGMSRGGLIGGLIGAGIGAVAFVRRFFRRSYY